MPLEETIAQVREKLRRGQFPNEAAVSNGAVLPILLDLGWPVFDTSVVAPEYVVEGRRVDFALCRSNGQPVVFVEVKRVGVADSGERQLFEYAFHRGVPLAVLTDGQEWNFYLPSGEGDYQDRRVYKLDLLERELSECSYRLNRYLSHNDVASGVTFENSQSDYRDVNREREIERLLPQAWSALLGDADDILVELLAEKVSDLCGFKPDPETCGEFLSSISNGHAVGVVRTQSSRIRNSSAQPRDHTGTPTEESSPDIHDVDIERFMFAFRGHRHQCRNAIEVLITAFEQLEESDSTFPNRFASRNLGYKRRFLAEDKYELHPDRGYCEKNARQLKFGWFIDTKLSNNRKLTILKVACEVAGLEFGSDLMVNLG